MKATLYSKAGKKKDEVVLNPEIFGAPVNHRLLELVQNAYSANLRRGTADTKTRKEVSGGGKKPWKQKGTGRARHGSTRSPIWKGGGTVFGPHPRSYYVNMPRAMRQSALISALSLRGDQKNLLLLEDVTLESAKTKEWVEVIKALPLEGKRALCVVSDFSENLQRASRNAANWVDVQRASDFNAYDVLQRPKILIEQNALAAIEKRLLGTEGEAVATEEGSSEKAKKPAKSKTIKKVKKPVAKKEAKKPAAKKGKKK